MNLLDYAEIGDRIRQAREEQGLSQDDLGVRIGYTSTAVNYYEKGKRRIALNDLYKVAQALGKPLSYFLGESFGRVPTSRIELLVRRNLADVLGVIYLPVVGTVAAGEPLLAQENIEGYIPFPKELAGSADCALRVRGESMVDAGINSGDFVLVKQARETTENGQVVVALLDGEVATLKMLWQDEEGQWWLKGANREFKDVQVDPSRVQVLGIYAGVFKPPRK